MILKRLPIVIACLPLALLLSSCGKPASKQGCMPIYITPYYNSDGLQVNVGKFSKELASMTAANAGKRQQSLRSAWAVLSPQAMYVAAIRLFDLGLKDDAAYWFYSGQYRARLFQGLFDPAKAGGMGSRAFELKHAYNAFYQLSGEHINGYSFGDPIKLATTVEEVQKEGKTLPDIKTIFPDISFVEESKWPDVNKEINLGMTELIDMLKNNVEEIKTQRESAGTRAPVVATEQDSESARNSLPGDSLPWPEVHLTGVIGKGANGACLINGQVVPVGEEIQGVMIVEIKDGVVVTEFRGERRVLRPSASR